MAFFKSVVAKSNTTTNKLGTNSHTLHMCCQNFTCWTYSSAVPASSTNCTSSEFTFWRHLNCVCTKVKTWHVIFIIENKFICTQYTGVQNNYVFTVQALQPISTSIGVSKIFCHYCASITTYIYPYTCIQSSFNRF